MWQLSISDLMLSRSKCKPASSFSEGMFYKDDYENYSTGKKKEFNMTVNYIQGIFDLSCSL